LTKDWDPALYRAYEAERTQPAIDLLARVRAGGVVLAYDLGCGPGNSTELLADRYSYADIIGIDTSHAMIGSARMRLPGCRFETRDIASWRPQTRPDLIYANAALQWVPDHEALFPRLLSFLAPGGTLAVQMPDNDGEPSHRLMRETAENGPWADRIRRSITPRIQTLPLTSYYDLLASQATRIEIWRTVYHHRMETPAGIVEWVRGTGLRPYLDPLDLDERNAFLAQYEARIAEAYRPHTDGRILLPFPRKFVVATMI
jgi:trans-aconitate 2-methyltransferase